MSEAMQWYDKLPRATRIEPGDLISGHFKSMHSDFLVEEILGFSPAGEGNHLWLYVRKTGVNTDYVTQKLRSIVGIPVRDIGFSGLKDKNAETSQWFSVPVREQSRERQPTTLGLLSDEDLSIIARLELVEGLAVVEARRHNRKLRRGTHAGNHFEVILRKLRSADQRLSKHADFDEVKALLDRLQRIELTGFPNYFGAQRFGHDGKNLRHAQRMFASTTYRPKRHLRGLYLSAARSRLFNAVCAKRIEQGCWLTAQPGEPLLLDGSRSFFIYNADDAEIQTRIDAADIHTSGVLWGHAEQSDSLIPEEVMEFERYESAMLAPFMDVQHGLVQAGLKKDRRALRAMPTNLVTTPIDRETVKLSFDLSSGVYATALLRELGDFNDQSSHF